MTTAPHAPSGTVFKYKAYFLSTCLPACLSGEQTESLDKWLLCFPFNRVTFHVDELQRLADGFGAGSDWPDFIPAPYLLDTQTVFFTATISPGSW